MDAAIAVVLATLGVAFVFWAHHVDLRITIESHEVWGFVFVITFNKS